MQFMTCNKLRKSGNHKTERGINQNQLAGRSASPGD